MRVLLSVCVLTLLVPLSHASDLDTWQSRAVDKVEPSIVVVKVGKTTGTGVIIDERGYIVTNHHVVKTAAKYGVKVRLNNGTELTGTVAWSGRAYDLAVIRVTSPGTLPALNLASTASLKRGHHVLAIGHPYGYEFSVCEGIVSNLGRTIELDSGEVLNNMIQTTAPINVGNSGGPLLNQNGELIGINTALREDAQNIAFAINASTVKQILSTQLGNLQLAGLQSGSNVGAGAVASVPGSTTSTVAAASATR